MNINLSWGIVHSRHLIVEEVGLIDDTVGRGDLAGPGDAGAEDGGAFELLPHHLRIGYDPRIERGIDVRNADCALIVDFHLDHRRHIRVEAAVDGDAHAAAFAGFLFTPTGFHSGDFGNPAQSRCVIRIFLAHSRRPLRARIKNVARSD